MGGNAARAGRREWQKTLKHVAAQECDGRAVRETLGTGLTYWDVLPHDKRRLRLVE
jgi:hypothetical protein